jgi:CBS domain containing-hemolysin-like protein
VDEHGSMQGVVTLEDLLEELVGEIYDESDEDREEYMEIEPGEIVVDGGAELRVVEQYFGRDLPGKPTDTVNRWILLHTGRIPEADERFTLDGLDVLVRQASGSRIDELLLKRHQPIDVADEENGGQDTAVVSGGEGR